MKKYVLYPGVGRVTPERPLGYISGRQLAHCYRVPYSECLDTDLPAVKKVMQASKTPIYLTPLLPQASGNYRMPDKSQSKIILATGQHELVNKNG